MEGDTELLNSNTETHNVSIVTLRGFAILTLHFSNTCSWASADMHKSLLLSVSKQCQLKKIPFERQLRKPHLTLPFAAGAGAP